MKRQLEIFVHIFFWIGFTGLTFILSKVYLQADPFAPLSNHLFYVNFLELMMGLIFFYTSFFGIGLAKKKKGGWIVLSAILLLLLIFFAIPAMRVGILPVMSSVIPHIILIFLAVIFRRFSDSARIEKEKQELLLQNVKSELAILRMQLSPHFLFNTLNNIDFLVTTDPEKASDSLARLGTILRYMIYETEEERIDLEKEIKHLEDYIGLLRLRSGSKDFIRLSFNIGSGHLRISPMLFQPLVENAFKHCTDREINNAINISISVSENALLFMISNDFDETEIQAGNCNGLGLNNVKRRLELIYPGKHTFDVEKRDKKFTVTLKLELDDY
jgi:sensor histidine kinase YesM